ncbi:hypothetical protein ACFXTO_001770 [Malus domestica]
MPFLQEFHIRPSPQLKEEFARQMDPENGQHYWIVEHVQNVRFIYKVGPSWGEYETHVLRDSNFSLWSNA